MVVRHVLLYAYICIYNSPAKKIIYICIYTYACLCVGGRGRVGFASMCVCARVRMCGYLQYIYIYIYIYVYIYIYMCVYTRTYGCVGESECVCVGWVRGLFRALASLCWLCVVLAWAVYGPSEGLRGLCTFLDCLPCVTCRRFSLMRPRK